MPADALGDVLQAPITWLTAALSLLAGAAGMFDSLWALLSNTSGLWFPLVATAASVVAPAVEAIPMSLANKVLLAAAILYMTILLVRFANQARDRFGGNKP